MMRSKGVSHLQFPVEAPPDMAGLFLTLERPLSLTVD